MPKELRATATRRSSPFATMQPQQVTLPQVQAGQRNAAIWNDTDDRVLISARASGLNWQPIASRHFPNKTANACRKRHERLMERRSQNDWDGHKLDALATEYMECRKEMWTMLAARTGERWALVEAKCMEKGLKNLQAMARAAQKKRVAVEGAQDRGNEDDDHEGDSGLGVSDAEIEVGEGGSHMSAASDPQTLQPIQSSNVQPISNPPERQAPPTLPLYQPPASLLVQGSGASSRPQVDQRRIEDFHNQEQQSRSPDEQVQRGVSIRSMLSDPAGSKGE